MQEIELKFQIPDVALDAVLAAVHDLSGRAPAQRLQAAYFDTPDRKLAKARAALRVRQEDDEWVQTLKAAATPLVRLEDNAAFSAPAEGQAIAPDLSLHQGDAAMALQRDLGWTPTSDPKGQHCGLVQLYRTDMHRHRAELQVFDAGGHSLGWVELALDLGAIHAGDDSMRVQELEIELLNGSPMAVVTCGRQMVDRFGLWLDTQTKAHRGDQLARQAETGVTQPAAPSKPRTKIKAGVDDTPDNRFEAALHAITDQVTFNMSELASPYPLDEIDKSPWRHAWLVGLRRLRMLLRHEPTQQPSSQTLHAHTERLLQLARQRSSPVDTLVLTRAPIASHLCLDLLDLSLHEAS